MWAYPGGMSEPLEPLVFGDWAPDEPDPDEDQDDDDYVPFVRAKGILDGSITMAEAANAVRVFADELQKLADAGAVLLDPPVSDDYLHYETVGRGLHKSEAELCNRSQRQRSMSLGRSSRPRCRLSMRTAILVTPTR